MDFLDHRGCTSFYKFFTSRDVMKGNTVVMRVSILSSFNKMV